MRRFLVPVVGAALFAAGCGGGTTDPPPDTTTNLTVQAGDGQSAPVGQAIATAPSVKVANRSGAGVAGVAVTFAVSSGGGTGSGLTQTTNGQGIATVGGWTLGTTAGPNAMTATIAGSAPVTISATATAGPPNGMAKTGGDNQSASVRAPVTTRPAVKVSDQFGNPVPGAGVLFAVAAGGGAVTGGTQTTDAAGVATVGAWTMGPTQGENRLTASVSGSSLAPVTFTATGQEVLVQPSKDTTFQAGTVGLTRLVIPAGRIVTVAGNLVINADSAVVIAGTLKGSCAAITINGEQTVTISGVIDNQCPSPSDPGADLRIVAKGGYTVTGAGEIATSGKGVLTNDPSVTGPAAPPALSSFQGLALATSPCQVSGKAFVAKPIRAKTGTSGTTGQKGDDASNSWTLWCKGADLELGAGVRVYGQSGGHGGVGADLNKESADAKGGAGGRGGDITVGSTARVVFTGAVEVTSGDGGDGGDAKATGSPSKAGQTASSAKAEGGVGAGPGLVRVVGTQGIVGGNALTIILGRGGHGGNAEAIGADGVVGKAPGPREQDGGPADAKGGVGAGSPSNQLTITGNAAGVPAVAGGDGGKGGDATATGGKGATAITEIIPDGGHGGAMKATGGRGGNSEARSAVGALFGDGGMGGFALFKGGRGGNGWNDCEPGNIKAGGRGGNGGAGSGGDGAGGTGFFAGDPGNVFVDNAGNGGNGGNGVPVGEKGDAGADAIVNLGTRTNTAPVFLPGAPGLPCAPPPPQPQLVINSPFVVIDHIVGETSCPTPRTLLYTNNGSTAVTVTSMIVGTLLVDVNSSQGNGTIQPGQSRSVVVQFNCGQARSVNAVLKVMATVAGNQTPQVIELPVTVNTKVRALKLDAATGGFGAGTVIPLANITGASRVAAHVPICSVEHVHESVPGAGIRIQGSGPFPDPAPGGCGYGEVVLMTLAP